MAHFAELNDNNIVIRVIVVNNDVILDDDGNESEQKGIDFCNSHFGGRWVQTSYNARIRKNYAGIGSIYDPIEDAFYGQQPFFSWTLNKDTFKWEPPIPMPDDNFYIWNEELQSWELPN